MADTNTIRTEYFENDYDEVKIKPITVEDDSSEEMAQKLDY